MATIAIFDLKKGEKTHFIKMLKGHKLLFFDEPLSEKNIAKFKNADIATGFITSRFPASVIRKMPKLKLIATRSTGFDHIDLNECKKRKITVCNVPFYGENTVAEHTFALILSLSRNIHKSYVRTLRDDFSIEGLTGFDLKGKTIGVVGGGHIGLNLVKMAKGFGMKVVVYDVRQDHFMAEVMGFEYRDLDDLLKESDIVSLHVPYNKYTHHLLNRERLFSMKKGSILINTARGGIVDTVALYDALKEKHLGGAGLDVIEGEDLIMEEKELLHNECGAWKTIVRDEKIFKMENVVFTPHNAFNSKEALMRILNTSIDNIKKFLEGKKGFVVE